MADIPGSVARGGSLLITGALIDAGDLPAAESVRAAALARCGTSAAMRLTCRPCR